MRRTKHVIAVVVVATALCADRSLSAAPAPRTQASSGGIARTIASKLTSSFRCAMAPVLVKPDRSDEKVAAFALPIREAASGVRIDRLSPFQFRLPPPIA